MDIYLPTSHISTLHPSFPSFLPSLPHLSLSSSATLHGVSPMKADWLRAAMADDNLVADLLLTLNRLDSRPPSRSKPHPPPPPLLPPFDWGMRLPRSKSSAASPSSKKDHDATRRSPTTPLSWTTSGAAAASPSDSCEESSRPLDRLVSAARFKGNAINDANNSVSASKRARKKKTFAELKEEESSLLKEKKHLNKELESLRMKFEEHRLSNENLKRIKLDLHAQLVPKQLPALNEDMRPNCRKDDSEREASTSKASDSPSNASKRVKSEEVSANVCAVHSGSSNEQPIFVLPDLNMMPEEDSALKA